MEVTGLWLNRGTPRVKRAERREIRSEVRRCIELSHVERISGDYHDAHTRVSGRVAKLNHLKHPEAARYRSALQLTLPIYGRADIIKTRALVNSICKTPARRRDSLSYIKTYYRYMHRINIVARTDSLLAKALRNKMKNHAPAKLKDEIIHG